MEGEKKKASQFAEELSQVLLKSDLRFRFVFSSFFCKNVCFSKLEDAAAAIGGKYLGIYFSASWCPPCHGKLLISFFSLFFVPFILLTLLILISGLIFTNIHHLKLLHQFLLISIDASKLSEMMLRLSSSPATKHLQNSRRMLPQCLGWCWISREEI